jgi:dTDP-4-dehydrorhamnose 3,5-epimerase
MAVKPERSSTIDPADPPAPAAIHATRFDVRPASLPGISVLTRKPARDARGWLERMYDAEDLRPVLGDRAVVSVNRTLTARRGTVRGMHFQHPPHAETKLVHCLRGAVLDVAVDLRRGSPTFLHWFSEELSAENARAIVIPEGFAHGFQSLEDHVELLYLHTAPYRSSAEGGLNPLDPRLAIRWPLPVENLSPRDAAHPLVDDAFEGIIP